MSDLWLVLDSMSEGHAANQQNPTLGAGSSELCEPADDSPNLWGFRGAGAVVVWFVKVMKG